jgi:hypothetical protein
MLETGLYVGEAFPAAKIQAGNLLGALHIFL